MLPQYYAAYKSAFRYYATGYPMYNPANSYPLTAQAYAPFPAATGNQNAALPNQSETLSTQPNQNAGKS